MKHDSYVESEALTAVVVKSSIFWDITLRNQLKFNWLFGGNFCLLLYG
jgi:hypothetical protein